MPVKKNEWPKYWNVIWSMVANYNLWPSVRWYQASQAMPGLHWQDTHTGSEKSPDSRHRGKSWDCFMFYLCDPTTRSSGGKCIISRKCIVSRLPALIVCNVIAFCDILPTSTHHKSLSSQWRYRLEDEQKQGHFNFEEIRFWLPHNVMMGFQLIFRIGFKVYYHVPMLHPPRSYEFLVGSGQNFWTWKEEVPAVNVKFIIWPISHYRPASYRLRRIYWYFVCRVNIRDCDIVTWNSGILFSVWDVRLTTTCQSDPDQSSWNQEKRKSASWKCREKWWLTIFPAHRLQAASDAALSFSRAVMS